jgi:hypothetical protein
MEIQVQLPAAGLPALGGILCCTRSGGEESLPPDYGGRASTGPHGVCLQGLARKTSLPRHKSTALWSLAKLNGLAKNPSASLKRSRLVGSESTEPVIMMTLVLERSSFAVLSKVIPSTPGIRRSVMTRSKGFSRSSSRASCPLRAVVTRWFEFSRQRDKGLRIRGSSSTRSISKDSPCVRVALKAVSGSSFLPK